MVVATVEQALYRQDTAADDQFGDEVVAAAMAEHTLCSKVTLALDQ